MATPPIRKMARSASQCTAEIAAVAAVESRPMNQVSVRFNTACTVLLRTSGSASTPMARMST
jgi:hypothetical protein